MLQIVNKPAVAAAFGRAAGRYNQHAELQRLCGERLLAFSRPGQALTVLDAGCGTGWFSQRWQQGGHRVTALDLSPAMLQQAQAAAVASRYQLGDIEALPFADGSFDRCWSNLAVQWCSDLAQALGELRRVTRPGGQLLFSTVAAGSLCEVGQAWQALGQAPPVNRFLSPSQIAAALPAATLRPLTVTLAFPDVLGALRSLKGIGATHLHEGRGAMTLSRRRLRQLEAVWPRDARGYLLTYQLILGEITRD